MPAPNIALEKAKEHYLFYVVANVVVYRKADRRCLILKRSINEKVHPGKYGVIGGKLEWNDLDISHPTRDHGDVHHFEHAVEHPLVRQAPAEQGLPLPFPLRHINSLAFLRPDGIPALLVKFCALYDSGDVKLEQDAFEDFAWVNEKEAQSYDCLEGIAQEIQATARYYQEKGA